MALIIEASYIVRKHDLLRKKSRAGLTPEEEKELEDIYKMTKDVNDELAVLHSQGIKIVSGEPVTAAEEKTTTVKSVKLKMTPEERKEKALAIVERMRANKAEDKEIMLAISAELGVANTYSRKMVKGLM